MNAGNALVFRKLSYLTKEKKPVIFFGREDKLL